MNPKTDTLLTYTEAAKQPECARALLLKEVFPEEYPDMVQIDAVVQNGCYGDGRSALQNILKERTQMKNSDWKMDISCNEQLVALIEKGIACVKNQAGGS